MASGGRWRLVHGSRRRERYWAGLTPRQWGFLAVGAFMLLCLTAPALMWLLSPRASIPALPPLAVPEVASGAAELRPPPEGRAAGDEDVPATTAGATGQPGGGEPGAAQPASGGPGAAQPASGERGPAQPGSGGPGAAQSGSGGPGSHATAAGGAGPEPGDLNWPLEGDISAGYGFAYSEVYGDWRLHPGIDIAGEPGDAVRAAAAGTVARVSREEGWVVETDHGGGVMTAYGSLGEAAVRRGQKVAAGQVIGRLGDTAHLHFEVRTNGSAQDPLLWLEPR